MSEHKLPKPLFDYVIILPDPIEVNPMLPDEMNKAPKSGVVKAIGGGKQADDTGQLILMQVKPEDHVMFGRMVGAPLKVGEIEYVVMKQSDLLLIL